MNVFAAINPTSAGTKQRVSRYLKKVFMSEEFEAVIETMMDIVGSHSIQKFASMHARRSGCSRGNLNVRGRWKRFKQMVDTYMDPGIPFLDAKTAAALCIGAPVKYKLRNRCGLDYCWLLKNVLPEVYKKHNNRKDVVTLSKALLWDCFDSEAQVLVPLEILKRVHSAYEGVRKLDPTVNPVRKVPLLIAGHEGQLIIEELFDVESEQAGVEAGTAHDENSSPATPEAINRRRNRHSSEMQAVFAQLMMIRKQNEELTSEIQAMRTTFSKKLGYLRSTVNRLTQVPARVPRVNHSTNFTATDDTNNSFLLPSQSLVVPTGDADDEEAALLVRSKPATLSKNPRSLHILWHENEFGIEGKKPAKFYNSRDRGANRHTYSKRKIFWDLVIKMVNRGRSANDSIDVIYSYYGFQQSVSSFIRQLQK